MPTTNEFADEAPPQLQPASGVLSKLPRDEADALQLIALTRTKRLQVAEAILRERVGEMELTLSGQNGPRTSRLNVRLHFHPDELALFDDLNWDTEQLFDEVGRVKSIIALQRTAGTRAERDADARQLDVAGKRLEKRRPQIEAAIAELQTELGNLERDAKSLQGQVEQRANAVAKLREKVPQHVAEEFSRKQFVKQDFNERIQEAETAVRLDRDDAAARAHLKEVQAERAAEVAKIEAELLDCYSR